MSKNPADESLDLINDILSETDPEFVEDLKSIDPSVLNGKEIQTVTESAAESKSFFVRFWSSRSTTFKMILFSSVLAGAGLPLLIMAYWGWLTPRFLEKDSFSFKPLYDETFMITPSEGEDNLFKLFPIVVYTVEIPEKMYPLKSSGKADYGRFSFYLEFETAADLELYQKQKDHVAEVMFSMIRKTSNEDWAGAAGKEKIRNEMLVSINKSVKLRVQMLRFKDIYLQSMSSREQ